MEDEVLKLLLPFWCRAKVVLADARSIRCLAFGPGVFVAEDGEEEFGREYFLDVGDHCPDSTLIRSTCAC